MSKPSEFALQKAAQCWCDPRVSNRIMDEDMATVFAELIDEIMKNTGASNQNEECGTCEGAKVVLVPNEDIIPCPFCER